MNSFLKPVITAGLLLLALFIVIQCTPGRANREKPAGTIQPTPIPMLPESPLAPSKDYADDWKKIDSLEQNGLYKSALEAVEVLFGRAKTDRNAPQVVKTLIYRGKLITLQEEDGLAQAIKTLEQESSSLQHPELGVFYSVLGEVYNSYLENNRWQIRQRTPLAEGQQGDILTWAADQLERKALDYYWKSLESPQLLSKIPLQQFEAIITLDNWQPANTVLRPTLYDLLAHRAIDYFSNERSYLSEPAYKFYLDQPEAFDPAAEFVKYKFETRDSTSYKWRALILFQDLINYHLNDKDPSALIDLDLKRLNFVHNASVLADDSNLFLRALEYLHKKHYNHPADAEIVVEIANILMDQDGQDAVAEKNNGLLRRAVSEAEDAISRHPASFGAVKLQAIVNQIKMPFLNVQTEQVEVPGKPVLVGLKIKNINKVWVRVIEIEYPEYPEKQEPRSKFLQRLIAKKPIEARSWTWADPTDYREHQTEVALKGLPSGYYAVLVSASETFNEKQAPVAVVSFSVSRLSAVTFTEYGANRLVLADRQSGAPIQGVKVDCFHEEYNKPLRFADSEITDANGIARPKVTNNNYYNIVTRVSYQGDTLWLGGRANYREYRQEKPRPFQQATIFTDRSLYRPGQTVYFKALALSFNAERIPGILPNTPITVSFYDANGQQKGTLNLRTNAYGTVNGSFTAPVGGLTGSMSIRADGMNGIATFNVEEYKRPKFEVTFQPLTGAYRLNDQITVKGTAKAYAGSTLSDAQVRYRVVRQTRYLIFDYGWFGSRIWPPAGPPTEIANGTVETDENGQYSIPFQALPDRTQDPANKPVFDYVIYADVTDINGETRSAQTAVSVGFIALQVNMELPATVERNDLSKIPIKTTNLAGQPQPAQGELVIQRLLQPKTFYQKRLWTKPDLKIIPEYEFKGLFPNLAWNGEDDPANWATEGSSRTIAWNTSTPNAVNLGPDQMQAGFYRITLKTQDAYGEKIEQVRIVRVWDNNRPETRYYLPEAGFDRDVYQPGEKATLWMGGLPAPLRILIAREENQRLTQPKWYTVNGSEKVDFPVTENDRGGFSVHWFTVFNNRIYGSAPINISVPWDNKDLTISYETFRDKLAPGQQETWKIKISGPKKEKVAAEMVAALYDASLDQFLPHQWPGISYPFQYPHVYWQSYWGFGSQGGDIFYDPARINQEIPARSYPRLNLFNWYFYGRQMLYEATSIAEMRAAPGADVTLSGRSAARKPQAMSTKSSEKENMADDSQAFEQDKITQTPPAEPQAPVAPPLRKNLAETVFFFPELKTDAEGNVVLSFTMNEALTRWKLLSFAHTKDLKYGLSTNYTVTQKDLMILPNAPRFFRAGDKVEFAAKVSNLSQQGLSGRASLNLLDAITLVPLNRKFDLSKAEVDFQVAAGQNAPVKWELEIPDDYSGVVTYQVTAQSGSFTDGEESTVPVVTNRMLVTETLPLAVRGGQQKTFVFESLAGTDSKSLIPHRYTLEFTANPAWLAVQSLPYLMEYPHECSEQVFSRFYANTLASSVTQKMPAIRRVYDSWKAKGQLKSNLTKNQELKSALLEETPWVLDAQDETAQQQQIALLFDLNQMADQQDRALNKLQEAQLQNGGFAWFPGGKPSWYITQHIATGFSHLEKLAAFPSRQDPRSSQIMERARAFCDQESEREFQELEQLVQEGKAKWEDDHLAGILIHYLYLRSFVKTDRPGRAHAYWLEQAEKYWLKKGLYEQGLIALALHRAGRFEAAKRIVNSLRERAQMKEELGMYWKEEWGMYWYSRPVETQSLMIEVFSEVASDQKAVEEMRIWLLKNKQTNRWESTKATAQAVYALLLNGENWLTNTKIPQIILGGKAVSFPEAEAGTGYVKTTWNGEEIKNSWKNIEVQNPNSNIAWGAAYFQYFEDLDKIKDFQKTPLTIVKQLYREENTSTGPKLYPVTDGAKLKPGDRIKVRIEIRVDRPMEFVHLKDMRASGFEPVNVLSGYRWQDGLGYYESTKDLATHFFIDYLPRGTFVFEYPLVAALRGDFSNGITTIQCMYAPEFSSHSKGIRVRID